EAQEAGIDLRARVKARGGDLVGRTGGVRRLQENGYGAKGLAPRPGGVALGRLLLEHENQALWQRPFQNRVKPGGGDRIGKICDDLEVRSRGPGPARKRMLDRIAEQEVKRFRKVRKEIARQM